MQPSILNVAGNDETERGGDNFDHLMKLHVGWPKIKDIYMNTTAANPVTNEPTQTIRKLVFFISGTDLKILRQEFSVFILSIYSFLVKLIETKFCDKYKLIL